MRVRFCQQPVSLLAIAAVIAIYSSPASAKGHQKQADSLVPPQGEVLEATESDPILTVPPKSLPLNDEETTTIVVTGSRIPRPNLTAVSPITVVSYKDVEFQGATMVEELLNRLPQVAPSQGAFISNGSTGTATVDLRNLGAERTLVLINGRRLAPGDPFSAEPDINLIPTTLLERVEILTGGASSVYGSDAVAGVVNFILNTKLEGLRIDGQASVFQHNNRDGSGLGDALDARGINYPKGNTVDGGRQDINIAYGADFLDARAHVTAYGGYRKVAELRQDERDYSACSADTEDDFETLRCGGSPVSYPGNFVTNFAFMSLGEGRTFRFGGTPFNFGPWNFYQRSGRRWMPGGSPMSR